MVLRNQVDPTVQVDLKDQLVLTTLAHLKDQVLLVDLVFLCRPEDQPVRWDPLDQQILVAQSNLARRLVPVARRDPTVLLVLRGLLVLNCRTVPRVRVVLADLVRPLNPVVQCYQNFQMDQVDRPDHLAQLVHLDQEDQVVLVIPYLQFHLTGLVDQQLIQVALWILKVQIHRKDLVVRVVLKDQAVLVVQESPVDQFHPMVLHFQRLPGVLQVPQVQEDQ
jgi:hypothetical protein